MLQSVTKISLQESDQLQNNTVFDNTEPNTPTAITLPRHKWRIIIAFFRNQERHLEKSLVAGKLEHRLIPSLPNDALLEELHQINAKLTLALANEEQEDAT